MNATKILLSLAMLLTGMVGTHADEVTEASTFYGTYYIGWQAFQHECLRPNECPGPSKETIRVADFVVGIQCTVPTKRCVEFEFLNYEGHIIHQNLLRAKQIFPVKKCFHQDESMTYRWDMLASAKPAIICNIKEHAIRFWDFTKRPQGEVCVMFGRREIGCVPITQEIWERYILSLR